MSGPDTAIAMLHAFVHAAGHASKSAAPASILLSAGLVAHLPWVTASDGTIRSKSSKRIMEACK